MVSWGGTHAGQVEEIHPEGSHAPLWSWEGPSYRVRLGPNETWTGPEVMDDEVQFVRIEDDDAVLYVLGGRSHRALPQ